MRDGCSEQRSIGVCVFSFGHHSPQFFRVCGVEGVRDLDSQIQHLRDLQSLASDAVPAVLSLRIRLTVLAFLSINNERFP